MSPESEVARLGPADATAVRELEEACFPAPWTVEQLAQGMERGVLFVYGIRDGQGLAAYCSHYAVDDEGEIVNIAVRFESRRLGFGRKLLGHVLQKAAERGIQRMFLEVRTSNVAAIALYEAFGFRRTGVRPRYYPDTGEDALLMAREL